VILSFRILGSRGFPKNAFVVHREIKQEQERRIAPRSFGRQGLEAFRHRARPPVAPYRNRQGDRLRADALAGLHPLPRRRPYLPQQQRGGAIIARHRPGPPVMAVRWVRPRRRASGGDLHADRHRQTQRHQPAGVGSPTCSPASPIVPPSASTSFCRGTGSQPSIKPPSFKHDNTTRRGPRRMLTAMLHARHKHGSLGQAYPSAERMQLSKLSPSNGLLK
jgi:hypothetical protein